MTLGHTEGYLFIFIRVFDFDKKCQIYLMFKISKLTDQAIRWEELLVMLHLEWHKLRMRSTKTRPTRKRPSIRRKSILTKTVLPLHLMA